MSNQQNTSFFDRSTLLTTLNSLVFSKLFCSSTIWSGTSQQNIRKLRIFHVIRELRGTPVEMNLRCRNTRMMCKWKNNLAPGYLCTKLSVRSGIHRCNTRQSNDLNIDRLRTSTAQRFFFYRAIKLGTRSATLRKISKLCIILSKLQVQIFYCNFQFLLNYLKVNILKKNLCKHF